MPVNGMKAADYQQQNTNPRLQTLQDIKGFYKSHWLELLDRIKKEYSDILSKRKTNFIDHFSFEPYKILRIADIENMEIVNHTWVASDRFFKLADEFYSDPTMWWVIALYNQAPTEFHLKLGDVIYVPTPLETVLFYIGY